MNISKYGKASLMVFSFLGAADIITTGGVVTSAAATLGLSPTVLASLKVTLQGISLRAC
jgi:hypothetical protein